MLDKARYIVVEGPIGAGKTSLAHRLIGTLQAEPLLEQPERNPFLKRFYQHIDRWALSTQLAFLMQRIEQLSALGEHLDKDKRIVSDFIFEKDPLFASLNLGEEEFALYRRIFDTLAPKSQPKPDLVIYLQADADTLLERIRRRGIDTERRITESYLAAISERYARFFYEYDQAPLFTVDAGVLNPVDDDGDFALLLERLRQMRGYREYFGYAG